MCRIKNFTARLACRLPYIPPVATAVHYSEMFTIGTEAWRVRVLPCAEDAAPKFANDFSERSVA